MAPAKVAAKTIAKLAMLAAVPALAQQVECHRNQKTDRMMCVNPKAVRFMPDNIRWASLYWGGPAGVRDSGFFVATNCKTGVTHLKDRDGVTFAGGMGNETQALTFLRDTICAAKDPKAPPAKPQKPAEWPKPPANLFEGQAK